MSIINNSIKEIHCKIIYYGPLGAGKTSSLKFIQKNSKKNNIDSFSIPLDSPIESLVISIGKVLGLKTFFHIYTVPDLSLDEKKYLLRGVDGIVFVANSELTAQQSNEQSLDELHQILENQKIDLFKLPLAFQYNKKDLSKTTSTQILRTKLNKYNCKDFESSVKDGQEILEPLKHICKSILTVLKSKDIQ